MGKSVSNTEEGRRKIFKIELSTSDISFITNKVNQDAKEWQNLPLDPVYLIVRMDGIVFKAYDDTICTVFPQSSTQICVVYQI